MVVFYGILNVGAIHAFVVCHINMNPEMAMGEFVKNLSPDLMSDHASVRASLRHVPWYFLMPYIFLYCLHGTSDSSSVYDIIKCTKISRMHLKDRKIILLPLHTILILRFSDKDCIVLGCLKLNSERK